MSLAMADGNALGLRPPYTRPADGHRPYGTHRFDVYSLKAARRLTLFGRASLSVWVQLEADATVTRLCERPLVVPDTLPRRVVDFWAEQDGQDRLIFLTRTSDPALIAKRRSQLASFCIWAKDTGLSVEEKHMPDETSPKSCWQDNWIDMLQHCSSYRASLSPEILQRVQSNLNRPTAIRVLMQGAIQGPYGVEPDVARAAIFELIRCGRARISNLESARLNDEQIVEPG